MILNDYIIIIWSPLAVLFQHFHIFLIKLICLKFSIDKRQAEDMGVKYLLYLLYFIVTQNILSQLYSLKIQDADRVETSPSYTVTNWHKQYLNTKAVFEHKPV